MIDLLVVMRLADMHLRHPAQDNTRVCAHCGERVGIFPSGQELLKADPTVRIICHVCSEPARLTLDARERTN